MYEYHSSLTWKIKNRLHECLIYKLSGSCRIMRLTNDYISNQFDLLIVCFRNIFQVYFMEIIVNFHLIHKCRGQQSRWLKLQLLWSSRKPIVCTYSFLMTTHIHPQVILGTRWGKYRNNNTCKFPIKLNPSSNNLSYQKTKSWKRSSFHLKLTISSFFRVISIW